MSSTSHLDSFLPALSSYTSEIIATGLFGVGFYLYRFFSDKTTQNPLPKAKEVPIMFNTPLHYYNQGLKAQILKLKSINPTEVIHEIELEGLKPDVSTFNTIMDGCFETGHIKQGFWVFDEMKCNMSYVKPDLISYNILLKGIGLSGGTNFQEIIEEILSFGFKPDLTTFNTILDHCFRRKDLKSVLVYLNSLRNNFLEPDHITLSLIYKGLKDYPLNEILSFCDLAQEIFGSDWESLYNVRIEACFNQGELSKALYYISEMRNLEIPMSAITYCVILKGYGFYKDFKSIKRILDEILIDRIEFQNNEILMGCLVDALVRCGAVEIAEELLLSRPKLNGNIVILSTLLKGFTRQKNMKKALELFQKILDKKLHPNLIVINSLLECAIQCGDFKKAEELFQDIRSKKKTDIITYSSYMKGLLKQNKVKETMDLLEEIRVSNKNELDEVLYNSIMDGLVKLKEGALVLEIYKKMQIDCVKPGVVTYSILMKGLNLMGEINGIFDLLNEMKKNAFKPGLIIYTCVIQGCIKAKKIAEMLVFYDEMIESKIKPDEVFLNIFISGLCFNNHVKLACQLTGNAIEKSVKLNYEVYGNVLRSLLRCIKKPNYENNEEVKKNLCREEAEIALLRLSCSMRKAGINIELGLYNEIASSLMFNSIKKEPPKFFNRNIKNK